MSRYRRKLSLPDNVSLEHTVIGRCQRDGRRRPVCERSGNGARSMQTSSWKTTECGRNPSPAIEFAMKTLALMTAKRCLRPEVLAIASPAITSCNLINLHNISDIWRLLVMRCLTTNAARNNRIAHRGNWPAPAPRECTWCRWRMMTAGVLPSAAGSLFPQADSRVIYLQRSAPGEPSNFSGWVKQHQGGYPVMN